MKKRIGGRRCLSLLLSLVLMLSLLPVRAAAANHVAVVKGTIYYDNIKDAWNAVKKGGRIDLLTDWNLEESGYRNCLTVEENADVTVYLNGHILSRGLAKTNYLGYGNGQIFYVKNGASLTINGGEDGENTPHPGHLEGDLWFPGSGAKSVTLTGGVLTGGACDDSDGAGAITMRKDAVVTLNNVTVAGNYADTYMGSNGSGGAIRMHNSGGTLNLNSSKIMYNHAEDNGGGIFIDDENCTVNMNNSEISHNFASDDGGGIYSGRLKTAISMKNGSKIEYNTADSGGGVYFYYSQFALRSEDSTASISHNTALNDSGCGGGVCLDSNRMNGNSGTIFGIRFEGNQARKLGGALYLHQESILVSGCEIIGNSASEGGGIYNDNDKNTISATTITGNTASTEGGGVFTSALNDITLSGKVIIKNNTRTDGSADDLYLNESMDWKAYILGSPTGRSEIGIRTMDAEERTLGKGQDFYFENAFFYNNGGGYRIKAVEDGGKTELCLVKASAGDPTTPTVQVVQPGAEKLTETYNGQPIWKGYFSYPSMPEDELDLDATYFYSDGYFLDGSDGLNGNPKLYNEHLATMSMVLAMAGFNSHIGNDGSLTEGSDRTYTYKPQNIKRLLTEIGVDPNKIYISSTNSVKPGTNTIGVAIGSKEIEDANGDTYILVPISVRGAGYESEWSGNTSVGASGEHEGFAVAADQVFRQVQDYIRDYGLTDAVSEGRVKFWISGYSRAGATSNLTAKRLVEAYCAGDGSLSQSQSNQVYAYCMEAPKGGLNSAMDLKPDAYYCIHNCVNKADPVPLVAPEEMGFIRYGVDHYVPGVNEAGAVKTDTDVWSYVSGQPWAMDYMTWYDNAAYSVGDSNYTAQREKMLAQLAAVDPVNIHFYDKFALAEISYISGGIGISDLITPIASYDSMTQEEFVQLFVRSLQAWGLYRSYDRDFRYGFVTEFNGSPSFEDALQTVTRILFNKSSDELNGMMEAAGSAMDRLGVFDLIDIWDKVIGDWTTLSQSERDDYLQQLWDVVMEGAPIGGKAAAAYLTGSEKAELRSVWDVLLDVLLRFVAVDYNTAASAWNKSQTPVKNPATGKAATTPVLEGISDLSSRKFYGDGGDGSNEQYSQVILGTLAKNATAMLQAHYHEVNFAWLRSFDSFYNNETQPVKIESGATPEVRRTLSGDAAVNGAYQGDRTLTLSEGDNTDGAAIFYRLKVDDSSYGAWMPYNQPIVLTAKNKDNNQAGATYTVQTTAAYCGSTSAVTEESYKIVPVPTYHVIVNGEWLGSFKAGDIITINGTPTGDDADSKIFLSWNDPQDVLGGPLVSLTEAQRSSIVTTFTMPGGHVWVTANYATRINAVTLTVTAPVAGQPLNYDGTLTWLDPKEDEHSKPVTVVWVKKEPSGYLRPVFGTAGYNMTCYPVVYVNQNLDEDAGEIMVFASSLSQSGVTITYEGREGNQFSSAVVNAEGTLLLYGQPMTTDQPKVTNVPELNVSILKDSTAEDLNKQLPKTVWLSTEGESVAAPLEYGALNADMLKAEDTYDVTATIDYADLPVDANGHDKATVKVHVYADGAAAAPTATVDSGNYSENKTVTLSSATSGATITGTVKKSVDGAPETDEAFSTTLNLTGEEGKTVVYTITAKAAADWKTDSPDVTFTYVIAIPLPSYTVTIHATDTGVTSWSGDWTYTYTKGEDVTIGAPAVEDEIFEKWQSADGINITGCETDNTLTVNGIQNDITLTAVYNPVVNALHLTMDEPAIGVKLTDKVTEARAVVTETAGVPVTGLFAPIAWTPATQNGYPAYNTAYTAKLTLLANPNIRFFLSGNLNLTVNGNADITATAVKEGNGYAVYVTFPATDKVGLVSMAQPANGYAERSEAANRVWNLPGSTTLTLSDGSRLDAAIQWQLAAGSSYDPDNLNAQTLEAVGTVEIPEEVNGNGVSNQVTARVYVAAAEQAKAPTTSLSSGSYTGEQTLRLGCETEGATIYYTLDGSEPTAASLRYDGGVITLPNRTAVTELRAIAAKDGMRESVMAVYRYDVTRQSSGETPTPAEPEYKTCKRDSSCPLAQFDDLNQKAWYHDGVHDCLSRGLMAGYGDGLFGPDDNVSRSQLVTVLWRMAGKPVADTDIRFTDVPDGKWYTDAVLWAAENGVVNGYGDGRFGPYDPITREQLAAMFCRFAKLRGLDVSLDEETNILSFDDAFSVSSWATESMQWACGVGLIQGDENHCLLPQGTATRAQTAAVLQRLSELSK